MHRSCIKDTVRAMVLQRQADAQTVLDAALSAVLPADVPEAER